jgi:hypothetical protein
MNYPKNLKTQQGLRCCSHTFAFWLEKSCILLTPTHPSQINAIENQGLIVVFRYGTQVLSLVYT